MNVARDMLIGAGFTIVSENGNMANVEIGGNAAVLAMDDPERDPIGKCKIITDDAEKTKSNVTSFTSLFKSAVQTAVKDALKHKTTGGSSSGNGVTKESIMAITNRAERQKMIAEHLDLFK